MWWIIQHYKLNLLFSILLFFPVASSISFATNSPFFVPQPLLLSSFQVPLNSAQQKSPSKKKQDFKANKLFIPKQMSILSQLLFSPLNVLMHVVHTPQPICSGRKRNRWWAESQRRPHSWSRMTSFSLKKRYMKFQKSFYKTYKFCSPMTEWQCC